MHTPSSIIFVEYPVLPVSTMQSWCIAIQFNESVIWQQQ